MTDPIKGPGTGVGIVWNPAAAGKANNEQTPRPFSVSDGMAPSFPRTRKVLSAIFGKKDPAGQIPRYDFYEPPFSLNALVPPAKDVTMTQTPTTVHNQTAIAHAIRAGQNVYLRGTTGMGKTNLVLFIASKLGIPLYEIGGEDTMDESNIIGKPLPGSHGFGWNDGKGVKAIKPVAQVPLPLLEKPARARFIPQGTLLMAEEAQNRGENTWIRVTRSNGSFGWVEASALSVYKTPTQNAILQSEPASGSEKIQELRHGDLLGVVEEKKIGKEAWSLVKMPSACPDDSSKTRWVAGWVRSADLTETVAAKHHTLLLDEPVDILKTVEPGTSLFWEERMDNDKEASLKGGTVVWSRVKLPNPYNAPGEEGYVPDFSPDPETPEREIPLIRASALLVDEANLIMPGVKKRLNSLLDDEGVLVIDENRNEVIKRHPSSLIFFTGNPLSYAGREQESADFLRRFHVVSAKDYNEEDYMAILRDKTNFDYFTKARMIVFHAKMVENAKKGVVGRRTGPYAYGTRDLLKLVSRLNVKSADTAFALPGQTDIYQAVPKTRETGMEPMVNIGPVLFLPAADVVHILSHEEHDGEKWTLVQFGDHIGYIQGSLPKESLFGHIWSEARKVYERRMVDESEKNLVETVLSLVFGQSNAPQPARPPVIQKLDDAHFKFGSVVLPVDPPGGKSVPDKNKFKLIVNDKTPEAARRAEMVAEQIFHGQDTMLVGPTAAGKTSYVSFVCMLLNRNRSRFNASDQTDKTRFIGKLLQKQGGGQFEFEWQNGLFTEAILPKTIRPTVLYREPGVDAVLNLPQNAPLYYLKRQKTVNGETYSLVQKHDDWMADKDQTGANALWVADADIQSDVIIIDEGNAARSGALEGANSLFDKNRRYLILEDFDGRKVYAHPSMVIFFTANPPEYGGRRYTGVNQISPAARNRFDEIWMDEVSPMPQAQDVRDSKLDERRKEEDAELGVYVEKWLGNLPNRAEAADWCVKFFREARNLSASHKIGAKRPAGEPLMYTIANLKNLAAKIVEFAADEHELKQYMANEILGVDKRELFGVDAKPSELKAVLAEKQAAGAEEAELRRVQGEWVGQRVTAWLASLGREEKLALGVKAAFLAESYHEFCDDFESEEDEIEVRRLSHAIMEGEPEETLVGYGRRAA